ncbi:MAG: spondin domain-containing protein [Bdellovibrionota bacterium]
MRTKLYIALALSLVSTLNACGGGGGGGGSSDGQRYDVLIENIASANALPSGAPVVFSIGIFAVHDGSSPIFTPGSFASTELESFAEDGDPSPLVRTLQNDTSIGLLGLVQTPVGQLSPSTLRPGQSYKTIIDTSGGSRFSLALGFLQGNDLFVADADGINLSPNGQPLAGDVTSSFTLYDAGTEKNEEPGAGANQGPRQAAPNTGTSESAPVGPVSDGFQYPPVNQILRVTITPQ